MSNNLNLDQVASNQTQKEVTINTATGQLDAAITEQLSVDLSAGNVTLTSAQFRQNMLFVSSGNAVSRDLTVPAVKRSLFLIKNGGTATLNVIRGSTTLTIAAGATAAFATDGTANNIVKLLEEQAAGTTPYYLGFNVLGMPGAGARVGMHIFTVAVTFPASLTGSQSKSKAASTGNVSFDIQKNGASVGSVDYNITTTGAFTFASPQSFAIGDILEIIAPGSQDATLADVAITLQGTR